MFILSMNGEVLIPLNYAIVMIENDNIVAVTIDSPFHRLMAIYSSHEVAMMAMRELLNHMPPSYSGVFKFPTEEELCADWKPSHQDHQETVIF